MNRFNTLLSLMTWLIITLTSQFCMLNAQNTDWIVQAKGISGQPLVPTVLNHITRDLDGNIYVSSNVVDSTQMGPFIIHGFELAPGALHLATEYLTKISPAGEVEWVQTFKQASMLSAGFLTVMDLATDANGNVFLVGRVVNEVIIDTITVSTNFSGGEMILAKFNSDGDVQWVEMSNSQPGFSSAYGSSLAIGPTGDIVVSGMVESNVYFQGLLLNVGGNSRQFLASYDSTGILNWVQPYGTGYALFQNSTIAVDNANNIYWVGTSAGAGSNFTATFDTITISTEFGAMFLAKFNEDGNIYWLNAYLGDSANFVPVTSGDLALDPTDNSVVISGIFKKSLQIGSTTLTESSALANDMFVAKFDQAGNAIWAKQSHGVAEPVRIYDMSSNDQGDVFIASRVFNSQGLTPYTLGEGANAQTITLDATTNGVLAKYKADGELDWMKAMYGPGESEFHAVEALGSNSAAITGYFTATAVLGDSNLVATPESFSSNVFVATCNGDASSGIFQTSVPDIDLDIYPNPTKDIVYISLEKPAEINRITLLNLQGQRLLETEDVDLETVISVGKITPGVYVFRFEGEKGILSRKLIIQ